MNPNIANSEYLVEDIFREAWLIYRKRFLEIIFINICITIPLYLFQYIIRFEYWNLQNSQPSTALMEILFKTILIASSALQILPLVAIAIFTERIISNDMIGWNISLHFGLSRVIPLIFTYFVQTLILIGLFLLFIIPGVIWSIYYYFSFYVVSLKNLKGKAALDYSKRLVKGKWWSILSIVLLLFISHGIITIPTSLIIYRYLPDQPAYVITQTLGLIVSSFFIVAQTVFFLNQDFLHIAKTEMDTATATATKVGH